MADKTIVLYHYAYSPYARRVVWYLALRGIPYSQCIQPPMMPRPDVAKLGITYRRIPIMSIGRDIYLDTRLMLRKLEELYPQKPKLGATAPDQRAMERLLEAFVIDGGIFNRSVQLIPTDLPLLQDPAYYKDRGDYIGAKMSKESMSRNRPESVVEAKNAFEFLEDGLLADGREWILGTERPGLADIEAVWPFHWLTGMPGALPKEIISATTYPKVFAWIARFQKAVSAAKGATAQPKTVLGEEALKIITSSPYHEEPPAVDAADSVVLSEDLKAGDMVTVYPIDTGSSHKDVGKLVGMTADEVIIETRTENAETVRVHAPRHGFRVKKRTSKNRLKL